MQSTVALVRTRPETVCEDIRRAMELAGIRFDHSAGDPMLLAGVEQEGWFPGTGTSPWQLDGVLEVLSDGRKPGAEEAPAAARMDAGWEIVTADLGGGGLVDAARGWGWSEVLAARGAATVAGSQWINAPVHAANPLPSLAAALPGGLCFPAPLQGRALMLLPVLRLVPGWPVAGSVALLQSLYGRLRRRLNVPLSEVRAEGVALARESVPEMGVVLDATVWGVSRRGGIEPVSRNVLLAGRDPVAVDAVATRLAGLPARAVPWLRLCAERGLGAVAADDIELVGSQDLADLDFQVPSYNLSASGAGSWMWRMFRRRGVLTRHRATPWGRLFEEYRSGAAGRGQA